MKKNVLSYNIIIPHTRLLSSNHSDHEPISNTPHACVGIQECGGADILETAAVALNASPAARLTFALSQAVGAASSCDGRVYLMGAKGKTKLGSVFECQRQ